MTKILLDQHIVDGVLLGEVVVDTEDFSKPNHAQSGKTLKTLVLEDPDKTGYTKYYLSRLKVAGVITQAEEDTAKVKASK